jgi:hypothetical protein
VCVCVCVCVCVSVCAGVSLRGVVPTGQVHMHDPSEIDG